MPNSHDKKGLNQAINNALAAVTQAEQAGYQQWIQAVNEMRRQVVLAIAQGGKLDPTTAGAVKAKIGEITAAYQGKFEALLSQNQRRLFTKGLQVVDKAAAGAGLTLAIPHLSEATLNQAQAFGAELVTNLTTQARAEIAKQIDLAVMGQKPMEETLAGIGTNLTDPSIFATITKRSEVIYRTEVNRMANLATDARLKQAQKQIPDLMKRWVHGHTGIPRAGHMLLDGATIGVHEKFKLIGRDGKTYLIDGPHDPKLPAGEVVNCKCQAVPVIARHSKDKELQAQAQKQIPATAAIAPAQVVPATKKPTPPKPLTKEQKLAKEQAWQKKMAQFDAAKAAKGTGKAPEQIQVEQPKVQMTPEQAALEQLEKMPTTGDGWTATIQSPIQQIPKEDVQAIVDKMQKVPDFTKHPKQKIQLKDLGGAVHDTAMKDLVKTTITGDETWAEPPMAVKHKGKLILVTGNEQVVAAHLQGQTSVTAKIVDLDAVTPRPAAPAKPIAPTPATAPKIPVITQPKPGPTAQEIATQKLNALPTDIGPYKVNPITNTVGLPKEVQSHMEAIGKTEYNKAKPQVVKLNELISGQSGVNPKKIQAFIDKPDLVPAGAKTAGYKEDLPVVVKAPDGKLYVYDGNHRLAAAKLSGKDQALVRVIEMPGSGSAPAAPIQKSSGDTHINVDTAGWKKIGGQAGSNPGGLYESADGQKYYVKEAKSADHQANEIAAAKLYRAAGIDVADVTTATIGGKAGVASKIVDKQQLTADQLAKLAGAKKGMAVDAWLANWDVVGLGADNLVQSGKKALRLDTGGALKYRAQGGAKGAAFGNEVHELDTLRLKIPGKPGNDSANAVFGKMTAQEIVDSIGLVEKISPATIRRTIEGQFPAGAEREQLIKTLLARRTDLIMKSAQMQETMLKYPETAKQIPGAGLELKLATGIPIKPVVVPEKFRKPENWDTIQETLRKHAEITSASDPDFADAGLDYYHTVITRKRSDGGPSIYEAKFKKHGITEVEAAALFAYTGSWYDHINPQLRSFTQDRAMRRAEALVNRALSKLPELDTKKHPVVYRKEPVGWYNEGITTAGQVVEFHGITSCAVDPNVWSGRVQYVITPKKGTVLRHVADLSASGQREREATAMSGMKIRVLRVEAGNWGEVHKRIYAEEI